MLGLRTATSAATIEEETVVEQTMAQETSGSLRREIEGLRVTTNRLRAETQRLTDRRINSGKDSCAARNLTLLIGKARAPLVR